jgi:hypothetical protein
MAVVGERYVDRLRVSGFRVTKLGRTSVSLPQPVACFYSPPGNDLLIVCQRGTLIRLPIPTF